MQTPCTQGSGGSQTPQPWRCEANLLTTAPYNDFSIQESTVLHQKQYNNTKTFGLLLFTGRRVQYFCVAIYLCWM